MKKDNNLIKQEMSFDNETLELIRKTVAVDANPNEFQMFIYQAKRTGLDPLARQIYCLKIGGKIAIQASIDGFRLVAQRSGEYAGQDEPEFVEENGKPKIAKVTVYKFSPKGVRYPAAVGVAHWDEYCPVYNGRPAYMWTKMPHTMLSKVAEALALRKAFPQELSGLYSSEEMDQAQPEKVVDTKTELKNEPIDGEVVEMPSEIIAEAEKTFGTKVQDDGCTCNTAGKFHKNTCPLWVAPS